VKAVQCSSCSMFEVRDAIGVPANYTCGRCTHLQLLQNRVRELELELDDLRIIREAEMAIDKSFRDIVTPGMENRWVTVRGAERKRSVQGSPVVVPLSNKYSALDTAEGDDIPVVSHSEQISGTESVPVAQKGKGESGRAIVIGDSLVRGIDRRFCGSKRDSRMVCCLPDARVRDVSDRVFRILKGEGEQSQVVVHIGTNDIGTRRDRDVKQEFREMGWKLRARTKHVVISGMLPVPRDSEWRNRERVELNMWLQGWCRREGFSYVDNWNTFWGRWDLYKQDGVHLNQRGTNILGGKFATALQGGLN